LGGLPTDRFLFAGFLPNTASQRRSALATLAEVPATLVFYESPHRVAAMLLDAAATLGGDRPACVARELTKKFEELRKGSLDALAADLSERPVKGEIVVLIGRAPPRETAQEDIEAALVKAMVGNRVKDAAQDVADRFGLPRRQVYQMALALGRDQGSADG
jgi:16S rRNA (cytidine1402-2'-O)-methyltransferase